MQQALSKHCAVLNSVCMCSFWFRFIRVWQIVRVTPLETYRAVTITSQAAKDVVKEMVRDSVYRARHAVDEARSVAERSRAKAELLEDRPCPDVGCLQTIYHCLFTFAVLVMP